MGGSMVTRGIATTVVVSTAVDCIAGLPVDSAVISRVCTCPTVPKGTSMVAETMRDSNGSSVIGFG